MFCLLLIFIRILFALSVDENLEGPIWSPLLFSDRVNYVLFAVTPKCDFSCFNILLEGFMKLENGYHTNLKLPTGWTTYVKFGENQTVSFEKNIFPEEFNCTECLFNESKVKDEAAVYILATGLTLTQHLCSSTATKEYTLLISDVCCVQAFPTTNATDECPKNYRYNAMMLPSAVSVAKCTRYQKPSTNDIFSSAFITNYDIENFANMTVWYYSKTSMSIVNLFAVINENLIDSIGDYIFSLVTDNDCSDGSFVGVFQISNENNTMLDWLTISMPFIFNSGYSYNYFIQNLNDLVKKKVGTSSSNSSNCYQIENYFENALSKSDDFEQYNILVLDSYPPCVGTNLKWNESRRHLEVIVFNQNPNLIATEYLSIIELSKNLSNHVIFGNSTEYFINELTFHSPICTNNTRSQRYNSTNIYKTSTTSAQITYPATHFGTSLISSTTQLIETNPTTMKSDQNFSTTIFSSTTQLNNTSPTSIPPNSNFSTATTTTTSQPTNNSSPEKWWIIGILLFVIFILITFIILFFVIRKRRRRNNHLHVQEIIRSKIKMSPLEIKLSHDKRLEMQLLPKNVIIDFNTILGRGSNATVYKVVPCQYYSCILPEDAVEIAMRKNNKRY